MRDTPGRPAGSGVNAVHDALVRAGGLLTPHDIRAAIVSECPEMRGFV
ncbi:hypothetical protein [Burkholderia cepacia]|nr:hypothetical protein [Burkholderia cepacia]